MTKKPISIDDIKPNNVRRCLVCGIPITLANDSGWEMFVPGGGGKTQPVCGWCDAERQKEPPAKSD
jgi:hypothetical protein